MERAILPNGLCVPGPSCCNGNLQRPLQGSAKPTSKGGSYTHLFCSTVRVLRGMLRKPDLLPCHAKVSIRNKNMTANVNAPALVRECHHADEGSSKESSPISGGVPSATQRPDFWA